MKHRNAIAEVIEEPGQFTLYALVLSAREGTTKNGMPYFDVELSDATGTIAAKLWGGSHPRALENLRALEAHQPVKLLFEVDSYRGVIQLNLHGIRPIAESDDDYREDAVYGEGFAGVAHLRCETLVFDIETVPVHDPRALPPTVAQAVAKAAERGDGDESKVMSLSPWFGKVVSVAFGEGEHDGPADAQPVHVLVVPPEGASTADYPDWMIPMSEPELLRTFWALASQSERVVSFNGGGFDIPFLVGRSLIHEVPVRVDLTGPSWKNTRHLDLLDALGRRRGPSSLDVVCWALGLTSPKGVMDGSMVAPTYATGDVETVAEYNAGDVRATAAVYRRVRDGLLKFKL